MKNDFVNYYDDIYSKKDYYSEVQNILMIWKHYNKIEIDKILDVGCGTGTHSIILAERGFNVTGIDIDAEEIKIANEKKNISGLNNVDFFHMPIEKLQLVDFNLCISMFNVINYFQELSSLVRFFKEINKKMKLNGLFLFDCWNGIAAIRDLPKEKDSVITKNKNVYRLQSSPEINLFKQIVIMNNIISIFDEKDNLLDTISYSYTQYLWTPDILKQIIEDYGFKVLKICPINNFNDFATENNWKILFIIKKVENIK